MKSNKENKMVVTADGTEALRTECRYIKGAFYKAGDPTIEGSGQCYLVDGKYCRDNTGYIVYDHGKGCYVKKTSNLINGVVDIKEDGISPIFGYFSSSIIHNVKITLKDNSVHIALIDEIFDQTYYREKLSNGDFYHIEKLTASSFNKKEIPNDMKYNLSYDSKGIMDDNIKLYKKFNDSQPTEFITRMSELLNGLSFGLEFETIEGFIPERHTTKLGLLPLRDGSIRGLEYVTIPLSGDKGLQTIIDSCKELNKRTSFDESCSLHLHLGNIPRTEKFILSLYLLLVSLEQEIYDMFPVYKQRNCSIKKKSYTKPLPILETLPYFDSSINDKNLVDNFNILYRYLSMGQNYKDNFDNLEQVTSHPSDPRGTSKWNIRSRYHWVNFIPLLFGNKQTVEFRLHTSTFDYNKILNFIFISGGIINFTIKNQDKILKDFKWTNDINLRYIFDSIYGGYDLGYKLREYCQLRKERINYNFSMNNVLSPEKDMYDGHIKWDKQVEKKQNNYSYGDLKFVQQLDANNRNGLYQQIIDGARNEAKIEPIAIENAVEEVQPDVVLDEANFEL